MAWEKLIFAAICGLCLPTFIVGINIGTSANRLVLDKNEKVWRGGSSQRPTTDMPAEMQQYVSNIIQGIPDDQINVACDIIIDGITNKYPWSSLANNQLNVDRTTGNVYCRWACANGDFDMTFSYTSGTLFATGYKGNNYFVVWRPICPAYNMQPMQSMQVQPFAQNPSMVIGSPIQTNVVPATDNTFWNIPTGCARKADGQPWTANDAVVARNELNDAGKTKYAKELAAFAINNNNDYKNMAQYVYSEMSKKYPRPSNLLTGTTLNGWWANAGCGHQWNNTGGAEGGTVIHMWFGETRIATFRPVWQKNWFGEAP